MTHQDQWTELTGDERLLWFLRVIEGAGGVTDAGDNPGNALSVFCEDRASGDDTYNLSEALGYTSTMHSGWGDGCAAVSITESGRAALAKAEAALADREQPGTDDGEAGGSEPSPRSESLSGEADPRIGVVMAALDDFHVLAGRVTQTQAAHVLKRLDAAPSSQGGEGGA